MHFKPYISILTLTDKFDNNKNKNPVTGTVTGLAADEGFEPSQTESESGVLPLHKSAKRKRYYTLIFAFVNTKLDFFIKKGNGLSIAF